MSAHRAPVLLVAHTATTHYARAAGLGWNGRHHGLCGVPWVSQIDPLIPVTSTRLATCGRCLKIAKRHPDEVLTDDWPSPDDTGEVGEPIDPSRYPRLQLVVDALTRTHGSAPRMAGRS